MGAEPGQVDDGSMSNKLSFRSWGSLSEWQLQSSTYTGQKLGITFKLTLVLILHVGSVNDAFKMYRLIQPLLTTSLLSPDPRIIIRPTYHFFFNSLISIPSSTPFSLNSVARVILYKHKPNHVFPLLKSLQGSLISLCVEANIHILTKKLYTIQPRVLLFFLT